MRILLDTSFIIELKRGNRRAREVLESKKSECEDLLVSSLTIYELLAGAMYIWKKYKNFSEFLKIQEILKFLTEIPMNSIIAIKASEMKAILKLKGLKVSDLDILIACSAEDAEILTFDKDFEKLKELGFKITILE